MSAPVRPPEAVSARAPDRRQFLLGVPLVAIAVASIALKPQRRFQKLSAIALDAAIPRQLGPYGVAGTEGLVLPQPDDLSARIYDAVLTRMYQRAGFEPIGLCIAYGSAQDAGLQLHRPDECYPAQGFTIGDRRVLRLNLAGNSVPATALTATRPDRTEQLLYWTRIGATFTADAAAERAEIYRENLRGTMPDGALVRLSIASRDLASALPALAAFATLLYDSTTPAAHQVLRGVGNVTAP